MSNERYDQKTYAAPTGTRILLHADPATGQLRKAPVSEFVTAPYTLPIAEATVLGGIKVGANLSINATTGLLDAITGGSPDSLAALYNALGSQIKAYPPGLTLNIINATSAPAWRNIYLVAIWLPTAATLTGAAFMQGTQGNYTADAFNGIDLCTYSGGTLTQVATTGNVGGIWKGASQTLIKTAFTAPYAAAAGLYFLRSLYSYSAVVTQPSVLNAATASYASQISMDFTNSAILQGALAGQTAFTTPQNISVFTLSTAQRWLAVY